MEEFESASIKDALDKREDGLHGGTDGMPRRGMIDDFTLPSNLEAKIKRRVRRSVLGNGSGSDWTTS